jgi:hypothetical protein
LLGRRRDGEVTVQRVGALLCDQRLVIRQAQALSVEMATLR